MSINAEPTLAQRVSGSQALLRRQSVGRAVGRCLGRVEVHGAEQIPASGPVVLAANHRAFLDGPLLFGIVARPANFLVKVEAFTALSGPVLRSAGQIPLIRHRFDPAPIRLCLRILDAGGVVALFPEGSRGDGLVRTARPGVGYFALRTGAVVVPVACHGIERLVRQRRAFRPGVRITFGAPLVIPAVREGQRVSRRAAADAAERVRSAMATLVADTAPGTATDTPRKRWAAV
jgi:1-acyl-sn-glycerol-3-phosphate acyltransferase